MRRRLSSKLLKQLLISLGLLAVSLSLPTTGRVTAQEDEPAPFGLPFAEPPGPGTWILVQPYGNTTGAYYRRVSWYGKGQGVHFGIDFSAPCGTEVVAIGDGVVNEIDIESHGSLPHNLMIHHDNGYDSFYGHLLRTPDLFIGQQVRRGEVVGLTGDPDYTCTSRPHLHLEIRDYSHRMAYNPAPLIEADWESLALIGGFSRGFARDLDEPRRWQYLDDQPDIVFGGPLLNDYERAWPPEW
jgi:murein DD-endopeptidase MepM/ murein hydrolase activator NlpD